MDNGKLTFTDVFDIDELQRLQDLFSDANEIASIITKPDGTPITKPSNFCRLCSEIVRKSEGGMVNCLKSDARIGSYNPSGPIVQKCLSVGLMDAGVSITIGDQHIANWLIGQVRTIETDETEVLNYASSINTDPVELLEAFREVPVISSKKFNKIAEMLFEFVNELSDKTYKNIQFNKEKALREKAVIESIEKEGELEGVLYELKIIAENLPNIIWKAEISPDGKLSNTYISDIADELLDLPGGTINNDFEKYFSYVMPEYLPKLMETIDEGANNPGQLYSASYQVIKGNGEVAWFESTGRGYVIKGTVQIFGITIDVTDKKKIEHKLTESEFRLNQSQQVANIGSYVLDIKTGIWSSTTALDKIFGLDEKSDRTFSDWMEILHPDDKKIMEDYFHSEVLEKGHAFNREYRIINSKDNQIIWVQGLGMLEFNELGEPVKMVGTIQNVTERKVTDELLRESESRYRSLLENLPVGVFRSSLNGVVLSANSAMAQIYGYNSVEELLKVPASGYYSSENPREIMIQNLMKKGFLLDYETLEKKKDGSVIWVSANYRLVHDKDTGDDYIDGVLLDVTERKKTEDELIEAKLNAEQNEARFKVLHNASFGGIAVHDKGIIIDCNQGLSEISGYNREELIGFNGLLLVAEESREMVLNNILNSYEKPYEAVGLRKNGDTYPVRIQGKKIPYQGKELRVTEFRDITEIKRAEQTLSQSEENFRLLVSNTFDGILISDKNGDYLYANKKAADITEYSVEELIGMNTEQLTPKRFRKHVANRIENQFASDSELSNFEAVLLQKSGKEISIEIAAALTTWKGVQAQIISFRDVTVRKKYELELMQAKQKAEESDRLKSAFLANMSHEIRTPMNGILGFTSLLQNPNLSAEQQQSYLEIIQKSGDRLLDTVNDIIEISKIETGQVSLALNEVNVTEQLDFLYKFFKPEVKSKGIQFTVNNDLSVEKSIIKTDEVKLNSILTNLIKNAIKFTRAGSITISCRLIESHLQFEVKDTGIGIPEERLEAIFDRFVQAEIGDTRNHEGSGLGLAISRSYVEMLKGDIWVKSTVKKGSSFYFTIEYLPIEQLNVNYEQSSTQITLGQMEDYKILIAEDEDISFLLIQSILSSRNYKIIRAKNGIETVEIIKNNSDIDLVLMDLKMPEMNGLETTQEIRKFNVEIPIIAQTAYALVGDKEKAINAGCNDYISKPIKKEVLLDKIEKLIKK